MIPRNSTSASSRARRLDSLGIDVHRSSFQTRHDRAAQSVERCRRPQSTRVCAYHARSDLRDHQRRQPETRPRFCWNPASHAARSCWKGGSQKAASGGQQRPCAVPILMVGALSLAHPTICFTSPACGGGRRAKRGGGGKPVASTSASCGSTPPRPSPASGRGARFRRSY